MTKVANGKPYFILAVRDERGVWGVEFGDYDKETVQGERDDYIGKYEETADGKGRTLRARDLKIVTVKPAGRRVMQADTDRAIDALNAKDATSRPLAAPGLISYRCKSPFGFVMIGATDNADAMKEALRSTPNPKELERWNGAEYVPAV